MLIQVGELAKRAGLTVRTLHHYEQTGLLTPSARSEAGYRLYNLSAVQRLHMIKALAQAGLDNGDADATPDTITTPFIITPPISRVDAKSGQTLRIKLGSSAGLAKDKETLWWLNLLEIPPVVANQKNEGQNVLQLAIRSRFKFIYRPAGLGNRDAAAEKLTLTASGSSLGINNPTPFYITVSRISRDGGKALNSKTVMLAPQSSQTVALSSAVTRGETLTVNNINDYGADVAVKVAVK